MNKTYSELVSYNTFEERLSYLMLRGCVGKPTFGSKRYLNQTFYSSSEWRSIRDSIIIRDNSCDLGLDGYPIFGRVYIHHINPITEDTLIHSYDLVVDPENLICVSFDTHNAIHYANDTLILPDFKDRAPNDTAPWRVD